MKKKLDGYENYSVDTEGNVYNDLNGIIRKFYHDSGGRCMIDLYKNNIRKKALIHRLVAIAFIPNPLNKPQVNHINGDYTDNRVDNLEWATDSENKIHAFKNGLKIPFRIPVFQYSLENVFIDKHISIFHASKKTKVDRKSIKMNVMGKYKKAGGFIWKLN